MSLSNRHLLSVTVNVMYICCTVCTANVQCAKCTSGTFAQKMHITQKVIDINHRIEASEKNSIADFI